MANSKNTTDYYVYMHRSLTDGKVFYVGKGCGNRANKKTGRNKHWRNIVNKYGYTIELYATGLQEWYALELEIQLIAYYGRENLCNYTDGGEGTSGASHNEKTKSILSHIARNRTEEHRKKLSLSRIGKKSSFETKNKQSISHIGKKKSAESSEKTASFHRGRKRSEETKSKLKYIKSKIENTNAKKIICIDIGVIFDSAKNASKWLNSIGKQKAVGCGITRCLKGNVKTAYGFHWEYA